MIKDALKDAEHRMQGALRALEEDLAGIRTGRATPALVERLEVEYYGTPTPLMQLASISVPEPRQLLIKPFDPSTLRAIERAIMTSDLGINPNNDGKNIRLILPPLTEERRRELVKVVHHRVEEARVAIRNVRRDVKRDLKEFEDEKLISEDERKRAEDQLDDLTKEYIEKAEALGDRKEKEVMEV
ncbi:MAG TPA: ribosome recycling factor [Chloroflexi bacterium]|nr:ribosome recycling factor [Chloroflexota bacterium]